jgi:hypothetical protein
LENTLNRNRAVRISHVNDGGVSGVIRLHSDG